MHGVKIIASAGLRVGDCRCRSRYDVARQGDYQSFAGSTDGRDCDIGATTSDGEERWIEVGAAHVIYIGVSKSDGSSICAYGLGRDNWWSDIGCSHTWASKTRNLS